MRFTPCFLAALTSSTAPFITPWSVRPSAGWSNAAARAASASILQAPSRREYSEWTCRWAQAAVLTARAMLGAPSDVPAGAFRTLRASASLLLGDALDAVGPPVQQRQAGLVAVDDRALAGRQREASEQRQQRRAREGDRGRAALGGAAAAGGDRAAIGD